MLLQRKEMRCSHGTLIKYPGLIFVDFFDFCSFVVSLSRSWHWRSISMASSSASAIERVYAIHTILQDAGSRITEVFRVLGIREELIHTHSHTRSLAARGRLCEPADARQGPRLQGLATRCSLVEPIRAPLPRSSGGRHRLLR